MSRSVRLRRFVALLAGMVVLGACEGEPDDPFFFFGTVRDAQGTPLAGVPIQLLRGKDGACLWSFHERPAPTPVPEGYGQPLDPFLQTTTEPDGLFLFEVLRYQQGWQYCFHEELSTETGAKTIVGFNAFGSDFEADRVVLWGDGYVDVSPAADGQVLQSVAAPLPASGPAEGYPMEPVAYEWDITAGGKPLWRQERTATPVALDSYLREDFGDVSVKVDMLAQLVSGGMGGVDPMPLRSPFTEHASGPPTAIAAATSRVPASRAAACAVGTTPLDPCPLTDGKLDLVPLADPMMARALPIELTLPAPIRPSLLIMRDLQLASPSLIQVDGSTDGVTWQPISEFWVGTPFSPEGPAPQWNVYESLVGPVYFIRQPLTPPADGVTHLRLGGGGLVIMAAREISFFE